VKGLAILLVVHVVGFLNLSRLPVAGSESKLCYGSTWRRAGSAHAGVVIDPSIAPVVNLPCHVRGPPALEPGLEFGGIRCTLHRGRPAGSAGISAVLACG